MDKATDSIIFFVQSGNKIQSPAIINQILTVSINSMGQHKSQPLQPTSLSCSQQQQFMRQVCYIQTSMVPYMGQIQIYRFKQSPYDYIMKNRRIFSSDDPSLGIYLKNVYQVYQIIHKNIAQIHYFKNSTQFHMCGKSAEIEMYCNYYAITLDQIIRKRRKDDIRFTSNQLWYVLKCLLEVSIVLKQNNYKFGLYRPKYITLSSQGYLKLYILHVHQSPYTEDQLSNNLYQTAFNDRQNIFEYLPLPPEYIPSLKAGNLLFPFNSEKEDSFMIATVLLEMMVDEDVRKYYAVNSEDFCVYKRGTVWKDIGLLGYVYDKKYLLALMQKMLCEDPQKRISPQEALDFISENRDHINLGGSLRMFQDQQNHIKPKISYRTSFDFESSILKTIQPNILEYKLTACPIKTISKKGHNKSIGVSLTSSKKSIETKDKSLNKSKAEKAEKAEKASHTRGSSLSSKVAKTRI